MNKNIVKYYGTSANCNIAKEGAAELITCMYPAVDEGDDSEISTAYLNIILGGSND